MQIKAKQIVFVGAFIILTLIGYMFMPKDEVVINLGEQDSGISGEKIKEEFLYVHIEGAIKQAGIKQVPKGTRVFEVIKLAGGETEEADISRINLASIVKDEQKIYVPFKVSETESEIKSTNNNIVNINLAGIEELQKLDGIGPSMAKNIVSYREEIGYFNSIEDIKNVNGIGESKYNKIKDKITI